jgi:hypothetical protein
LRIVNVDRGRVHAHHHVCIAATRWARWWDPSAGELGSILDKWRWQALRIRLPAIIAPSSNEQDSDDNFLCIDIGVLPNQRVPKYARREGAQA